MIRWDQFEHRHQMLIKDTIRMQRYMSTRANQDEVTESPPNGERDQSPYHKIQARNTHLKTGKEKILDTIKTIPLIFQLIIPKIEFILVNRR